MARANVPTNGVTCIHVAESPGEPDSKTTGTPTPPAAAATVPPEGTGIRTTSTSGTGVIIVRESPARGARRRSVGTCRPAIGHPAGNERRPGTVAVVTPDEF